MPPKFFPGPSNKMKISSPQTCSAQAICVAFLFFITIPALAMSAYAVSKVNGNNGGGSDGGSDFGSSLNEISCYNSCLDSSQCSNWRNCCMQLPCLNDLYPEFHCTMSTGNKSLQCPPHAGQAYDEFTYYAPSGKTICERKIPQPGFNPRIEYHLCS